MSEKQTDYIMDIGNPFWFLNNKNTNHQQQHQTNKYLQPQTTREMQPIQNLKIPGTNQSYLKTIDTETKNNMVNMLTTLTKKAASTFTRFGRGDAVVNRNKSLEQLLQKQSPTTSQTVLTTDNQPNNSKVKNNQKPKHTPSGYNSSQFIMKNSENNKKNDEYDFGRHRQPFPNKNNDDDDDNGDDRKKATNKKRPPQKQKLQHQQRPLVVGKQHKPQTSIVSTNDVDYDEIDDEEDFSDATTTTTYMKLQRKIQQTRVKRNNTLLPVHIDTANIDQMNETIRIINRYITHELRKETLRNGERSQSLLAARKVLKVIRIGLITSVSSMGLLWFAGQYLYPFIGLDKCAFKTLFSTILMSVVNFSSLSSAGSTPV